ncbi:MAG: hypothetical protein UX12_C0006G0003 [Candidatus Collierbacteria bacterium GW2011_GWC1_45_47]|uniref:YdhG-like domain-containing protein n=5 Tax=Candidatus Collieribacteriota TaxID=1752725 RepID=A0A0G1HGJ0_9BACT|nr:MAG: hypothetical protein UW23_C0009G0024 [Candidatus Collierbacteria bacterium GW2011_GWA1_44_12]KKT46431.1 MAG: hypothetical protein UW35_C0014G0014 [Candidatus Collierbacteria bacterium GW2011_GWF2_44_15]KKT68203.1 MAG: hypothetical protein UW62_C0002G0002 [Candidatus Collierbacteria bacterium GW2011_GWB1_44_35]KKU00424.1 MAG: hypothetical protein UW99_C0001G0033 [Candidatus Collierbacteria bacterium GW2011_GWC2_45_15]KKU09634.1 MAG: hypothetical protein UX12_C0006G0003 [Candidatus Collie
MDLSNSPIKTIDEYIESSQADVRESLHAIREVIAEEAPQAKETIKYQMPTFVLNGNLVHFAAFKGHIGFYPTPSAIEAFKNELTQYITSKGAIQFPKDRALPLSLIRRMVQFRVKENTGQR